jgi:hypothetical protein
MCRRIQCTACGKPSFAGCGMHIEQVLGDVPRGERCRCADDKAQAVPESKPRKAHSWWQPLRK